MPCNVSPRCCSTPHCNILPHTNLPANARPHNMLQALCKGLQGSIYIYIYISLSDPTFEVQSVYVSNQFRPTTMPWLANKQQKPDNLTKTVQWAPTMNTYILLLFLLLLAVICFKHLPMPIPSDFCACFLNVPQHAFLIYCLRECIC